jgi:hypothetical protein
MQITFDEFRLQDGDLLVHVEALVKTRWDGVKDVVSSFILDTVASALLA